MEPSTGRSELVWRFRSPRHSCWGLCGLLMSQSQPSCNKRSCPSIPTLAKEGGRKMMRTTGPARGPGTVERESGKKPRADWRGSLLLPHFFRACSGRPPPRFGGREKRDRLSRARTKTGSGIALAMHFLFSDDEDWMPQDVPNDDRHPEARAIASRLWPTCALLIRSRVNSRSVGAGPGLAAHPSPGCEPRPRM